LRQLLTGLALSIALLSPLSAQADVTPYKATYASEFDIGIAMSGELTRSLRKTSDGQWLFSTLAEAMVASIKENTTVTFSGNQVTPQTYLYKRKVLGKTREATLTFDWENTRVTNNVEKKPWTMDIPQGTQDKLSYQLQMRLDLMAGKKGPLSYQIADGGRLKTYDFNIIGTEMISAPMGEFEAIKVEMDRGTGAKRETYIWFAPALDYIIVQLNQTEPDGKTYSLQLKSLETE